MQSGNLNVNVNDVTADREKIYLATDRGFTTINRIQPQTGVFFSKVIITEIVTDTSLEVNETNYEFKSGIPRLLLKFSYPVFNPANKRNIEYRLTGNTHKSEWNSTSNNEVEFSSLIPGKYIFEVKPYGSDDEADISRLMINIIPKWWQTTIAKTTFVFFILTGLIFYIRRRLNVNFERKIYALKQAGLIESERNRIASDMHDDIGADLTQISILLSLLKHEKLSNNKMFQKVTTLSRGVLSKMDQIIWALNSTNNTSTDLFSYINSYAREYLESSEIKFEFNVEKDFHHENLSSFQRRNVFLVVKELLHNTVKHSKAKKVSVKIYFENEKIMIAYSDDGQGIQLETKGDGHGLNSMKKRMEEIHSDFFIDSIPGKGFSCYLGLHLTKK